MGDSSSLVAVIAAFATLIGAAVGGFLSYLGARRQDFVRNLVGQHRQACEQVKAFYKLESLYCDALASNLGRSRDAVLEEFRKQVEEVGYARPVWTEHEAQKSISRFC